MDDVKDTLRENRGFYRGQERSLAARLATPPKGRIRADRKGGETYFYLQYRRGSDDPQKAQQFRGLVRSK